MHGEARINHLALSVPVSATRTVIVKLQSRSIQGSFQIVKLAVSRKQDFCLQPSVGLDLIENGTRDRVNGKRYIMSWG